MLGNYFGKQLQSRRRRGYFVGHAPSPLSKIEESGGSSPPDLGHLLKEAELLRAVTHQHVLVSLPADTRLFVPAKRRMGGIGVIAIRPYASRLDCTAEAVASNCVAAPDARAKAVKSIVGNRERILVGFERCH